MLANDYEEEGWKEEQTRWVFRAFCQDEIYIEDTLLKCRFMWVSENIFYCFASDKTGPFSD